MAIDCLVRLSFQSEPTANQAANEALVGDKQTAIGSGPFQRVNTAVYRVVAGVDADVIQALNNLVAELNVHSGVIDFVGISLTRRRTVFNIEFEPSLREELVAGLIDLARIELELARAAEEAGDQPDASWEVRVGPLGLHCTQRGKGQARSYYVTKHQ